MAAMPFPILGAEVSKKALAGTVRLANRAFTTCDAGRLAAIRGEEQRCLTGDRGAV